MREPRPRGRPLSKLPRSAPPLSKSLRAWRLHRGWSLRELAAKADVLLSTVNKVEQGREPQSGQLYRLAKALGVTMESLIEGETP